MVLRFIKLKVQLTLSYNNHLPTIVITMSFAAKYRDRIVINPDIRSGKPCIVNTRIAVADIFDYLGGGMTIEEILDDFPDLTLEDIQACFAFAAERDRRLMVIPYEAAI